TIKRYIGTHAFVSAHQHGIAPALRDVHRHYFVIEMAGFPSCCGTLVATDGKCVRFFARDVVVAREVLRGFYHAADFAKSAFGLRPFASPLQSVVQAGRTGLAAPA